MSKTSPTYSNLISEIGEILADGRQKAFQVVNRVLVETYWRIGKHIVEYEQEGQERAEYGARLLTHLAKDLRHQYGRSLSRRSLSDMRSFYRCFPIWQTVSAKLSWSHYVELSSVSDELARSFYEQQCIKDNWSVRELKRQRNSALFERIALSKDKKEILELSQKGQQISKAADIIRDPFVFEFLSMPEQNYREKDLEKGLTEKLEKFLLELGKGFAFIGRQYRITLDNTHFYIDLLFYHHILKCFVLIDLKTGKVNHQDIGQMNLYLNYFINEESTEGDNPPIGMILAADKNDILVEYATQGISNQLFVSKYQLYLPDKKELAENLADLLNSD
ncbi:MAG: PDDEXK nuclease domain-containing protein [Bacteroidota bacterium]